jgi:hypothetical protein
MRPHAAERPHGVPAAGDQQIGLPPNKFLVDAIAEQGVNDGVRRIDAKFGLQFPQPELRSLGELPGVRFQI